MEKHYKININEYIYYQDGNYNNRESRVLQQQKGPFDQQKKSRLIDKNNYDDDQQWSNNISPATENFFNFNAPKTERNYQQHINDSQNSSTRNLG